MFVLINTLILALIYVIMIAFMISKSGFNSGSNDDENDSGDGGWDGNDGRPPLDLPPGVFILPPDADDPSIRKHTMMEEEVYV